MKTNGIWLITHSGMASRIESMAKIEQIGVEGVEDVFRQRPETFIDSDGIAHIHATGCLLNNPPTVAKVMGDTSYQDIVADIEEAERQGARAMLAIVDSPGGMAEGAQETAERWASVQVPTVTHSEGSLCSAAYYFAAGSDGIAVTNSSSTGSIGSAMAWQDGSGLLEKIGVQSGVFTNEGADLKRIDFSNPTDEQQAYIQEALNESAGAFQEFVSEHRESLDKEAFRAGHYGGEKALKMGLVDAVGTQKSTLSKIVGELQAL